MTASTLSNELLHKAVLVVAHPDDEVLWFSSVVSRVGKIVICYSDVGSIPEMSNGRRAAAKHFPLKNVVFLQLQESEALGAANWEHPERTQYGIAIKQKTNLMPGFSEETYKKNFVRLKQLLAVELKDAKYVFTHNPWGEYGHEEHIQVFRAIELLQNSSKYSILFSNYCSERSVSMLLNQHLRADLPHHTLNTDKPLAASMEHFYKTHGCWTWFNDYEWPDQETFFELSASPVLAKRHGAILPVLLIRTPPLPASDEYSLFRKIKHVHDLFLGKIRKIVE